MNKLELEFESDNKIFVEVSSSGADGRVREVSRGGNSAPFSKVSESISNVVKSISEQIDKLPSKPDMFQIEVGAEIKGEADLWLVSGESKGHVKITMKWEKQ